jgi:hypothetical protein
MRALLLALPSLCCCALASPALAGPVDDDPEPWEVRARPLLAGPPGCVEVRGEAEISLALVTPGGWRGPGETRRSMVAGTFSGQMQDGVWQKSTTSMKPVGDGPEVTLDAVVPVMGKVDRGDGPKEVTVSLSQGKNGDSIDLSSQGTRGLNLIDTILEEVQPETTVSWIEREANGDVVLFQQSPVRGARADDPLEIRTVFPGGGPPRSVDVRLPKHIKVGDGLIKADLMRAQVHLRAAETAVGVLPTTEGVSLVVGVLGFTVGVEQHLTYTQARVCPPPQVDPRDVMPPIVPPGPPRLPEVDPSAGVDPAFVEPAAVEPAPEVAH